MTLSVMAERFVNSESRDGQDRTSLVTQFILLPMQDGSEPSLLKELRMKSEKTCFFKGMAHEAYQVPMTSHRQRGAHTCLPTQSSPGRVY